MRQPRDRGAAPSRSRPPKIRRSESAEVSERKPLAKDGVRDSSRAAPAPLRADPGVYIVQTQPGFESIAWSEIVAQDSAREKTRDAHRARARRDAGLRGVAPRTARRVRCAEDLFAIVAYRRGLGDDATSLDKVRAAMRGCTHLDEALNARVAIVKGARAGKKLRFKVVARLSGEHEFRRVDFKHAVETGILEHGDHAWRLDEDNAEVEFWATMLRDELIFTLRLSDDTMRFRDYKISHRPGSLRPSVAAALALVSNPAPDDVFLDPLCGTGTMLIERAHCGPLCDAARRRQRSRHAGSGVREYRSALQAHRDQAMGRDGASARRFQRRQNRQQSAVGHEAWIASARIGGSIRA